VVDLCRNSKGLEALRRKKRLTPRFQSCSGEKFISYRTPPQRQPPVIVSGLLSVAIKAATVLENLRLRRGQRKVDVFWIFFSSRLELVLLLINVELLMPENCKQEAPVEGRKLCKKRPYQPGIRDIYIPTCIVPWRSRPAEIMQGRQPGTLCLNWLNRGPGIIGTGTSLSTMTTDQVFSEMCVVGGEKGKLRGRREEIQDDIAGRGVA
jgi:hypothetical protein